MIKRNAEVPTDSRIEFRVGINLGDVIIDGDDIYGDGVNIAARLEGMAERGGICISRTVRDHVRDRLPFVFRDMGEQQAKNISRPVRIYALEADALRRPDVLHSATIRPEVPTDIVGAPAARAKPTGVSIVVLPFANLSNDPEQEYFADGITEDLTTDLSRIPGSLVIARNTAFTYKGKPIDVKRVGRDLDVDYVIEGSVRRAGEQVRVNIQLIDAATATHLWAERFDTDRVNLADAQNEIAGRLARTLNLQLIEVAARRIEQQGAVDPEAGDLLMRGWASYYRSKSAVTFGEAQHCFRRALNIDPCSVDARIGLALCLVHVLADGLSRSVEQDEAQAEQLLHEALDRDANRPMAHVAMGLLRRIRFTWRKRGPNWRWLLRSMAIAPTRCVSSASPYSFWEIRRPQSRSSRKPFGSIRVIRTWPFINGHWDNVICCSVNPSKQSRCCARRVQPAPRSTTCISISPVRSG